MTRNLVFNRLRSPARQRLQVVAETPEEVTPATEDPALRSLAAEERQRLEVAVATALEPLEQQAVHLRYVENLSVDAVTRVLQLTNRSGSRTVLRRAERKLKKALGVEAS